MHLASDYLHPTPGKGRCRVRIFLPDDARDAPVVLMAEPWRNRGASLKGCVDRVAAEVAHYNDFSDQLLPVFIEHNEKTGEFWLVTFSDEEIIVRQGEEMLYQSFGVPERMELDRKSVERLVSQNI